MLRSLSTNLNEDGRNSIRVKHVQDKLNECRRKIESALAEIEDKFPKSIFDNVDSQTEYNDTEMAENAMTIDDEEVSQMNGTVDDRSSGNYDQESSKLEISPPTSPYPIRRDINENETISNQNDQSEISSQSPPRGSDEPKGKRTFIKHEMMKLFKITTGTGSNQDSRSYGSASRNGSDVLPLVTSVPREPNHSLLLLFALEVPKVLGTVCRISANADGYIAGCTVHGEIFVFNKVPYSRNPDCITRGHEGGVVSITWLSSGSDLRTFFLTNGTDKKSLIWQVTDNAIEGPHCELRHASVPTCCCIHPVNKDIVIIGSLDNSICMFKIEKTAGASSSDFVVRLNPVGIGASFTKPITALSVSPDGRRLVVGSSVGTIGLFDLNTLSLDVEVDCRNRQGSTSSGRKVVGLHWSRDSTCVVVSSCDSRIRVVLVSDLSRRTKFKSSYFTNENLFLSAVFGPPEDERIISVSESGYLCSWQLHTRSETNENCVHCDLVGVRQAKFGKDKDSSNGNIEMTASCVMPATDSFCDAIQAKTFTIGEGFQKSSDVAVITCDTSGSIRIFAELFTPI